MSVYEDLIAINQRGNVPVQKPRAKIVPLKEIVFIGPRFYQAGEKYRSDPEEHFGYDWVLCHFKDAGMLVVYVECRSANGSPENVKMYVKVDIEMELRTTTKKATHYGIVCGEGKDSAGGAVMSMSNLWEDEHTIRVWVTISRTEAFYSGRRPITRPPILFDHVIQVQDVKFKIIRQKFMDKSPVLDTLIKRDLERNQTETVLDMDIDPFDFHKFVLHIRGQPLMKCTFESIYLVAHRLKAAIPISKCNWSLFHNNTCDLRKKFQLALQYEIPGLKDHCLNACLDTMEIHNMIPNYLKVRSFSYLLYTWDEALKDRRMPLKDRKKPLREKFDMKE